MAEQDLQRFLHKVEQLQLMVDSLEKLPDRRELLAACTDHNQVVELARSWGYEIGRRWGETGHHSSFSQSDNLLRSVAPPPGQELKQIIHEGLHWRLELIISSSASSKDGFWYDQEEHEWILILRGSARINLKKPDVLVDLSVGDHLYLHSHRLHRVERTDPEPGTTWLALFWNDPKK